MRRARYLACGLMSGTSRDGIDVAVVEISGKFPWNKVKLIHAETGPYPRALRAMLMRPPALLEARDVATLDFWIGRVFGLAALKALHTAGIEPDETTVIGSHGQTLLHLPKGVHVGRELVRSTLQLGHGAVIAQTTGITTVSGFRAADIAIGGEGAPLVPIFDYVTLGSATKPRVALNIGGIANLTAIPAGGGLRAVRCFDTGPGNCMIDTAVRLLSGGRRSFDRNGALAARGHCDGRELERALAHPYFLRKPPKSTGWEEFGEELTRGVVARMKRRNLGAEVIVRTLTEIVVESITGAVEKFVGPAMRPEEVIVTGGGSRNCFLMSQLRRRFQRAFPGVVVDRGEAFGVNSDAREACAFAYLGYLCLAGIPGNLASANAGLKPAILGSIHHP